MPGLYRGGAERHFRHAKTQLAHAVNHSAATARVYKYRVRAEVLHFHRHAGGQRHIIQFFEHARGIRLQPLAAENNAAVIPKAGGVHPHYARGSGHFRRAVMPLKSRADYVYRD